MTAHSAQRDRDRRDDARMRLWLMVFGFALLAYVGGRATAERLTERACLAAGYTAGRVTVTWGRYCTARVDNSDVVLPLAEARRRPRR